MTENITITPEKAKVLTERWLRGDEDLTLQERVFVLEKMTKRLLVNEALNKKKGKQEGK